MKILNKEKSFDTQKCIWMSNGLLDYKLCDRNFDCENCKLDIAMRNAAPSDLQEKTENGVRSMEPEFYIQHLLHRLSDVNYSQNFLSLKNQILARNVFDSSYYFGLSPLVNLLIDKDSQIDLINNNQNIYAGDELLCISGNWGRIFIDSPITFRMLGKINDSKITKNNWFCLAEIEEQDIKDSLLTEHSFKRVKYEIARLLKQRDLSSIVGHTMNDGGTYLNRISDILGMDDFQVILKKLFPESKI
ncbi:MAG: hypothetical protein AB9882_13615 [Ignavibacteriaceae bacterium]